MYDPIYAVIFITKHFMIVSVIVKYLILVIVIINYLIGIIKMYCEAIYEALVIKHAEGRKYKSMKLLDKLVSKGCPLTEGVFVMAVKCKDVIMMEKLKEYYCLITEKALKAAIIRCNKLIISWLSL